MANNDGTTKYPNQIDNFPDKVAHVDKIAAADINSLQAAIEAIENVVGVSGSYNFLQTANDPRLYFKTDPTYLFEVDQNTSDPFKITDYVNDLIFRGADGIYINHMFIKNGIVRSDAVDPDFKTHMEFQADRIIFGNGDDNNAMDVDLDTNLLNFRVNVLVNESNYISFYEDGNNIGFDGPDSIFYLRSSLHPLFIGGKAPDSSNPGVYFDSTFTSQFGDMIGSFYFTGKLAQEIVAILDSTKLDLYNKYIKNVLDPVDDQDAATKKYVDDNISGLTHNSLAGLNDGDYKHLTADEYNNVAYKNQSNVFTEIQRLASGLDFNLGNGLDNIEITADAITGGASLNLGQTTSKLWNGVSSNIASKWIINIGNAGNDTPIWKLIPSLINSSSHYVDITEWKFNHYIDIPNMFNGDTDTNGFNVQTALRFIADTTSHYTPYIGWLNSAKDKGIAFYYKDDDNKFTFDMSYGGDVAFVINSSDNTNIGFYKDDYASLITKIDQIGLTLTSGKGLYIGTTNPNYFYKDDSDPVSQIINLRGGDSSGVGPGIRFYNTYKSGEYNPVLYRTGAGILSFIYTNQLNIPTLLQCGSSGGLTIKTTTTAYNDRGITLRIADSIDAFKAMYNSSGNYNWLGLNTRLDDNTKLQFGDDQDAAIYFDGTDLIIDNNPNGTKVTVRLKDIVWDDLKVPANVVSTWTSNDPSWSNWIGNIYTWAFSPSSEEEVFFNVQIPHSYREGENIRFHIHWSPGDSTSTGNVVWKLEYTWANIDGTFSSTQTITLNSEADGTSYKHIMTQEVEIDGTGKTASSMLSCRLYRDARDSNDTFGDDAYLLEMDFHIPIDKIGTNES